MSARKSLRYLLLFLASFNYDGFAVEISTVAKKEAAQKENRAEFYKIREKFDKKIKYIKLLQRFIEINKEKKFKIKSGEIVDLGYTSLLTGKLKIQDFEKWQLIFKEISKNDTLSEFLEKVQGPYTIKLFVNYANNISEEEIEKIKKILNANKKFKIKIASDFEDYSNLKAMIPKDLDLSLSVVFEQTNFRSGFLGKIEESKSKIQRQQESLQISIEKEISLLVSVIEEFFNHPQAINYLVKFYSAPAISQTAEEKGWIPEDALTVKQEFENINFERIKTTKLTGDIKINLDEEKLNEKQKEILENIRSGKIKEALESLFKEANTVAEFYRINVDVPEWRPVLEWIFCNLFDKNGNPDSAKAAIEQLKASLHHCADSQDNVLMMINLQLMGIKSSKCDDIIDFYVAKLKEKLVKERAERFFSVTKPTMQKICSELPQILATKDKQHIFAVDQIAHFFWNFILENLKTVHFSGEARAKLVMALQAIIEKKFGTRGLLNDLYEIASFSYGLREQIEDEWGLHKEDRPKYNFAQPNTDLWSQDTTLAVMMNYFGSHFLAGMQETIEPLLRTENKNQEINSTTWDDGKISLKNKTPIDESSITQALNDLYEDERDREKAKNHILKKFKYKKSKTMQSCNNPDNSNQHDSTIYIMPGDLVEVETITSLKLELKNFEDEVKEREDFHKQSVEALLFHFGYLKKFNDPKHPIPIDPIIKNYHELYDNVPLVHAFQDPSVYSPNFWQQLTENGIFSKTGIFDESGIFQDSVPEPGNIVERHTLHFSWGDLVSGHNLGNWEKYPFAIIDLSQNFRGELVGTNRNDTMCLGLHKVTPHNAILVAPAGFVVSKDIAINKKSNKIRIFEYQPNTSLREAIRSAIRQSYSALKTSSEKPQNIKQDHDGSLYDLLEKIYKLNNAKTLSYKQAGDLTGALSSLEAVGGRPINKLQKTYIEKNIAIYLSVFGHRDVELLENHRIGFDQFADKFLDISVEVYNILDEAFKKIYKDFPEQKYLAHSVVSSDILPQLLRKKY